MKTYRVRWKIDIEAETPEEAAARALIVQRNQDEANVATVFDVSIMVGLGDTWLPFETTRVDLRETTAEQAEEKVRGAAEPQRFYRVDGYSGNGYICERCKCAWIQHIAPNSICPAREAAADREDLRRHGVEHHEAN